MEENNKEIVNNENVNEVMNTQQANSDGMLYNTQHQDEAATTSAVYGTTLQPTQVQLSQTTEMAPMQPSPVQLSQTTEMAPMQPSPVQLSKDLGLNAVQTPQPAPMQPQGPANADGYSQPQAVFQPQGGSQPMGFGPVQTPPPIQGAPTPKPEKKRTGLVAGLLCAAAVVIVIAVGVLLSKALFGGGGAKAQLAKGIANMTKEMTAYRSFIADDIGLTAINKMKAEKPVHTNIDVSFTDPSAKGSFSSMDLEIDAVSDFKKKMGEYDVSVGTHGIDISIGTIVAADNTLYVTVPIVFDDVYSLDLSNFGKDFNNSAWSELLDEKIPEEYSITLFDSPSTAVNIKDAGTDSELYKIMNKHGKMVASAMTFEKIKDKKIFTFDGTDMAYGGVRLTVDKDVYNEATEGMRDDILASDFYEDSKKGYQNIYGASYGEDMDKVVEYMFDVYFEQDIVLDFYLDKKGRIVNISTPEDIAVYGEYSNMDSIAVDIDFSGSERTLDFIDGGIYMQADDEIVFLGISRKAAVTDEYYTEDLTFSFQEDNSDEEITLWYTNEWGYEDHTFDLQMSLDADDNSIGLRADGSVMDIVKGEGYTFQIDHAAISSDEGDLLLMTGSIMTEATENKIEVPKRAKSFLDMTSSEIQELFYDALF